MWEPVENLLIKNKNGQYRVGAFKGFKETLVVLKAEIATIPKDIYSLLQFN